MRKTYNPDEPLVLGICGEAGSGKTTTATKIAIPVAMHVIGGDSPSTPPPLYHWEHLYFALPLYRMATARQNIIGDDAFSRQCYEIHDTLLEVFGRSLDYDELVDTVYEIAELPCEPEGKPREFLQLVGTDICRTLDEHCWVKWMKYKILSDYRAFGREQQRAEELWDLESPDKPFTSPRWGVVVSDVRFPDEAEMVTDQPNGLMVRLTCDPAVRLDRLRNRDGEDQVTNTAHISENSIDLIPNFDLVLDTTHITLNEQTEQILALVNNFIQGEPVHALH